MNELDKQEVWTDWLWRKIIEAIGIAPFFDDISKITTSISSNLEIDRSDVLIKKLSELYEKKQELPKQELLNILNILCNESRYDISNTIKDFNKFSNDKSICSINCNDVWWNHSYTICFKSDWQLISIPIKLNTKQ